MRHSVTAVKSIQNSSKCEIDKTISSISYSQLGAGLANVSFLRHSVTANDSVKMVATKLLPR